MSGPPLRLGVAGLGRAFTLMLPTFLADTRVQLVAACDPREPARRQFEQDFGSKAFATLEEMLAVPAVEAVYVASPHQYHAKQAAQAAAGGKHVLVEKPMALSLDECDAMIAACRSAGVQMLVGHCHSFDAPYLRARELVRSGDYGRVRMLHALNYTDFLYRPRRPEELDTSLGGGVVYSQAAHQVDIVRLLAGSRVTRVMAASAAWDPQRPTEGAYGAMLWFEDGAFANLTYSGYGHFDSDEWTGWVGELGQRKDAAQHGAARRRLQQASSPEQEARLKNEATYGGPAYPRPDTAQAAGHQHFGPLIVSCERADLRPVPDGVWVYADEERRHVPLQAPAVPRYEVIDELLAAVRDGTPPLHDGPWARATLQVCVALLESARRGAPVDLPG